MKKISLMLFLAAMTTAKSQCGFTGLAGSYCSSDPAVGLTPSPSGGSFSGPGVNGAVFTPSVAGPGTHTVTYSICGNNYSVTSGTYSFINTSSANQVLLFDDDVSSSLPIGFTFNFYCTNYTSFYISSNGFITFSYNNGADGCCQGDFLPNFNIPDNLIALAWTDLDPTSSGVISYTTIGTSPNRILLVTFSNVDHFSNWSTITAQIQLYESSNIIEIHTTSMSTDGSDHTMGIENSGGGIATPVPGRNADGSWSAFNDMQRFIPQAGCIYTQTTVVNGPTLAAAATQTNACTGNTVMLTANGANTYTWSGFSPSSTVVFTATVAGPNTLTVSGLDQSNCIGTATLLINVSPTPTVTISAPATSICAGSSITLTAGGASSYTWGGTPGAGNLLTVSPTVTTVFSVNGSSGPCAGSAQYTVTVDPGPALNAGVSGNVICATNSATLTGSGATSYTWETATGTPTSNAVVVVKNPVGIYTYSLTGTNSASCAAKRTVTYTVSTCAQLDERTVSTVLIYPNPAKTEFTIKTEADNVFVIYDLLGQPVRTVETRGSTGYEVKVNGLTPGLYFVRREGEASSIGSIIVE
jgi:hypothetical protein